MPAVPGCLNACALRHAGTPSPWHPKVPSVPSVPFHKLARRKKGCGYRLQTITRKTSSCTLKTISDKKEKMKSPAVVFQVYGGPKSGSVVVWNAPRTYGGGFAKPRFTAVCTQRRRTLPFPAPLMYTHTHQRPPEKHTHTHIYKCQ